MSNQLFRKEELGKLNEREYYRFEMWVNNGMI